MLNVRDYNREASIEYAAKWAYDRNPLYQDFDGMGGDCTNFISQCLYAGSKVMNYTPVTGWYYINLYRRTASWTGVENFFNFLVLNKGTGPRGRQCEREEVLAADIVQLYRDNAFTHTLLITRKEGDNIYVAAHTYDTYNKNLDSYICDGIRYIHINKVFYYI